MKKAILLLAIALIGFSSCKKDDPQPEVKPVYKPIIPPDRLPADSTLKPVLKG